MTFNNHSLSNILKCEKLLLSSVDILKIGNMTADGFEKTKLSSIHVPHSHISRINIQK